MCDSWVTCRRPRHSAASQPDWVVFPGARSCHALDVINSHVTSLVNLTPHLGGTRPVWPVVVDLSGCHRHISLRKHIIRVDNEAGPCQFPKWCIPHVPKNFFFYFNRFNQNTKKPRSFGAFDCSQTVDVKSTVRYIY